MDSTDRAANPGVPVAVPVPHKDTTQSSDRITSSGGLHIHAAEHQAPAMMPPHLLPLAGYIGIRQLVGRPIGPERFPTLRDVQLTVTQTRGKYVKGRGNDIKDFVRTRFDSAVRAGSARNLDGHLQQVFESPEDEEHIAFETLIPRETLKQLAKRTGYTQAFLFSRMVEAAVGEWLECGICDRQSTSAIAGHAPRMQTGQSIAKWGSRTPYGHAWFQVDEVVGDPLGHGSAMLFEDIARFGDPTRSEAFKFDADAAALFRTGVEHLLNGMRAHAGIADIDRKAQERHRTFINARSVVDPNWPRTDGYPDDAPVVASPHLIEEGKRAYGLADPQTRQNTAVVVGQQFGLSPEDAALPGNVAAIEHAMQTFLEPTA